MHSSKALALQGGVVEKEEEKNLRISGIFLFCRGGNRGRVLCWDERGTSLAAASLCSEVFIPLFPKSWGRGDGVAWLGARESSAFPAAPATSRGLRLAGMPARRGLHG